MQNLKSIMIAALAATLATGFAADPKPAAKPATSWTADKDVTIVKNADGTTTISVEGTKTLKNGETVTMERETVVTKTEDGRTWETDASRTGPKGTSTMSGSGTAVKTGDGVDFTIDREGTRANGTTWNSTTEGHGEKTGNTRKWTSTTNGESSTGNHWTTERKGHAVRSGDGTVHRNVHGTTTVNDKRSWNWHRNAKVTKTDTGRHVEVKGNRSAVHKRGGDGERPKRSTSRARRRR